MKIIDKQQLEIVELMKEANRLKEREVEALESLAYTSERERERKRGVLGNPGPS